MTPGQARLVWRHLPHVLECTPTSRLADVFGQPKGRYWLTCPSDSHPNQEPYDLRVRWRDDRDVWAGHYGRMCPRAEYGAPCWHAHAAVLKIALLFYDGRVPVTAADPVPGVASPPPPPERSVEVGAAWWD